MGNTKIRKDFKEIYRLLESSGLSRIDFCKLEDLKYSWFLYHQKRMRYNKKIGNLDRIELKTEINTTTTEVEFHYPDGRFFCFCSWHTGKFYSGNYWLILALDRQRRVNPL